jgi:hypothetical protein
MEYIIRQYIPEENREFLRPTLPPVIKTDKEAIEWAKYYGEGSSVYLRDDNYKEEQVYFVKFLDV